MISIDKINNFVEIKDLEDSLYLHFLKSHNLTGIRINDADGFVSKTITPYCASEAIKRLNFATHYNKDLNFSCIENMTWLEYLVLTIGYTENYYFNFSRLQNLELLSLDWNKKLKGLENLNKLNSLHFGKFKGTQELFSNYPLLEDFGLTQGNVKDLEFLKYFPKLKKLYLAYIPSIIDSSGLRYIYDTVEEIDIEGCSNLYIFNHLENFINLKLLRIKTKEAIPNLKWVRKLPQLEFLSIGDTNIGDGDFSHVKDVKYVYMLNKTHYNYRFDNESRTIKPVVPKGPYSPKQATKSSNSTLSFPHFGNIDTKNLDQDYVTEMEWKNSTVILEIHFQEETISKPKLNRAITLINQIDDDHATIIDLFKKNLAEGGVVSEYFEFYQDETGEIIKEEVWQNLHFKRLAFYPEDEIDYAVYDFGFEEIDPYVLSLKVNQKGAIVGCEMEN